MLIKVRISEINVMSSFLNHFLCSYEDELYPVQQNADDFILRYNITIPMNSVCCIVYFVKKFIRSKNICSFIHRDE